MIDGSSAALPRPVSRLWRLVSCVRALSSFTCPECHGTLWERREGELIRFRCRVGHGFTADTLLAEQSEALEAALWTALRALEEKAALAHRLTARARERDLSQAARRFEEQARDAEERAGLIRKALLTESLTTLADRAAPDGGQTGQGSVGPDGDGLAGGV